MHFGLRIWEDRENGVFATSVVLFDTRFDLHLSGIF